MIVFRGSMNLFGWRSTDMFAFCLNVEDIPIGLFGCLFSPAFSFHFSIMKLQSLFRV